jgi:hypothetical protein
MMTELTCNVAVVAGLVGVTISGTDAAGTANANSQDYLACLTSQGLTVDNPALAVHTGQAIYKDVMTGRVSAPYEAQLISHASGLGLDKPNRTVACALSNNPWDLH